MGQGSAPRRWFRGRTRCARVRGGRVDRFVAPRRCKRSAPRATVRARGWASGLQRTGIVAFVFELIRTATGASTVDRALDARQQVAQRLFDAARPATARVEQRASANYPRTRFEMRLISGCGGAVRAWSRSKGKSFSMAARMKHSLAGAKRSAVRQELTAMRGAPAPGAGGVDDLRHALGTRGAAGAARAARNWGWKGACVAVPQKKEEQMTDAAE